MSENLLDAEFGRNELSNLGVIAYDERALSDAVLARAHTKALTGISTTASVEVCEALLKRTRNEIVQLESIQRNSTTTTSETYTARIDDLRIKEQLLIKLVSSKNPSIVTQQSATTNISNRKPIVTVREGTKNLILDSSSSTFLSSSSPSLSISQQIQKSNPIQGITKESLKNVGRTGLSVRFSVIPISLPQHPISSSSLSSSLLVPIANNLKQSAKTPLQLVSEALGTTSSTSSASSSLRSSPSPSPPPLPSTSFSSSLLNPLSFTQKTRPISSTSSTKSKSPLSHQNVTDLSHSIKSKEIKSKVISTDDDSEVTCPVCSRLLGNKTTLSDNDINNHVDRCLRRSSTSLGSSGRSSSLLKRTYSEATLKANEEDNDDDIFSREEDVNNDNALISKTNHKAKKNEEMEVEEGEDLGDEDTKKDGDFVMEEEEEEDDEEEEEEEDEILGIEDDDEDIALLPTLSKQVEGGSKRLGNSSSSSSSSSSSRGKL